MRSRRWSSKCDDRPRCRFFRRRAPAGCLFFGVVNNALPALRREGSAQGCQRMKTSVSTSDDVALLLAVEGRTGTALAARDDRRARPIVPRGRRIVRARAAAGGDRPTVGEFAAAAAHHAGAGAGAGGRVCRAGRARLAGRRGAPCDGLGEMAPGGRFADPPRDVSADEGGVTSGDGNMGGRLMLPSDCHHAESGPEQANVTRPNVCTALRCLRAPAWRQWQVSLPPR